MKLQNLTESLKLSEDQQAKIKPILEQETAEVREFWGNPVISQKDKLKRWEKIVRSSDAKMKPLVSQVQWENLESMRKEQKQELKNLVADQKASAQR
jgi:F0F1-type ATP synthase delta subunit